MDSELTDKQRLFAEHYVQCLNGTEAASRAGYAGDRNVLGVTAYENLRNPKIRAYLDTLFGEQAMGASEVLGRLAAHAQGDMSDFLSISGNGVRLDIKKGLAAGKGHLIKKYSKTDKGVSIELYDAHAALVDLGKHLGLFKDGATVLNVTPADLAAMTQEELDDLARKRGLL